MVSKIIFIHGNGGSTINDNWFPWVKKELEVLGAKVIAENFPDSIEAKSSVWLPFILSLGADEHSILVGHSSGAVAAMRFAEQNRILGSVLVSGSYTDLEEESEKVSGYFNDPWDWEKIKNNQKWIVQFASTDDPYIPIEEARYIHEKLDTEYHELDNQGHFGWDKGKKEFPELVETIKHHLS